MGKMSIFIKEEYVNIPGEGTINIVENVNGNCESLWTVTVETTSSVFVKWTFSVLNSGITKINGNQFFLEEETLTSTTIYTASMTTWKSPNSSLNVNINSIKVQIYDFEGGTILSSKTMIRRTTGFPC